MKKRILSALMALCLMLTLVPVSALAEEEPLPETGLEEEQTEPSEETTEPVEEPAEPPASNALTAGGATEGPGEPEPQAGDAVYVSADGDDERGNGSQDKPYATLAKAVDAAPDVATIFVMSDLTMTESARYWEEKNITITSDPDSLTDGILSFTISRAENNFEPVHDLARGGYNGALIEVGNGANLTLTNIILDDGGHAAYSPDDGSGPYFVQVDATRSGNSAGEPQPGSTTVNGQEVNNFKIVQDAMIASYDSNSTITLGEGAILQNYGGMSAVRVSGATLIMEDGSQIIDDMEITRTRGAVGSFGPAGAVWVQSGTVIMEDGSEICNMNGRAIYADGNGSDVRVNGTIQSITGNENMWQGNSGAAIYLRNMAAATLGADCEIYGVTGSSAVYLMGNNAEEKSTLNMEYGAVIHGLSTKAVQLYQFSEATINGEFYDFTNTQVIHLNSSLDGNADTAMTCTIGPNAYIHGNQVNYGAIYAQGKGAVLNIYGKITNNHSTQSASAICLSNNQSGKTAYIYEGAEISNNTANRTNDEMNSAVYIGNGSLVMRGGTIANNISLAGNQQTAAVGSGVSVGGGGSFIMTGGTITGNVTDGIASGVTVRGGGTASIQRGVITKNLVNATVSEDFKTVTGGTASDLTVATAGDANINRYLTVSPNATIGESSIYMQKHDFYLDRLDDVKLGNASSASETALATASSAKGWSDEILASLWLQSDEAETLVLSGIEKTDSSLPVYALVMSTDADGQASGTATVYQVEEADGTMQVTLPATGATGCAVALVQPTQNFGTLTLTASSTVHSGDSVSYTAIYTPSVSLKSMLVQTGTNAFTLTITPDNRLTAPGTVTVDGQSESVGSGSVTFMVNSDTEQVTFTFTAQLPAESFQDGGQLVTTAEVSATVSGTEVHVPSNPAVTKMAAQIITVTPADITIYQGGSGGYDAVVDDSGNKVSSNSLPHPIFKVTAPDGVDVTELTFTNTDSKNQWTLTPLDGNNNLYRFTATGDTSTEVRVQYSDENEVVVEDDFTPETNVFKTYTISIYTGNTSGRVSAKDTNGTFYRVVTGTGTLTVRAVQSDDPVSAVEESAPTTKLASGTATAVAPVNTVYTLNETGVVLPKDSKPSLLFDDIIEDANSTSRTDALKDKADTYLGAASSTTRGYEIKYLDLVDANNGNAWITSSKGTDIYWAYPAGTDASTKFTLLHFEGLHRDGENSGFDIEDIANSTIERIAVTTDEYGIKFHIDAGDFSPFALVWEEASEPSTNPDPGTGSGGSQSDPYLRFDSNGGTAFDPIDGHGSAFTINPYDDSEYGAHIPSRPGYRFTGWYRDSRLTMRVDEDETLRVTGSVTLFAGWAETSVPGMLNGDDHYAYIQGYADGSVRPNAYITRAQVATIFFRLLDEDVREDYLTTYNTFPDVNEDYWANTAISTMAALGVINGRNSGLFDPNAYITRAEFAAICARFDDSDVTGISTFTDTVGHWAEDEISRAAALGWIQGYSDGTFRPNQYITRAQAVTMINRVLCRLPEDADDLLSGMNTWTDCHESDWFYLAIQEATNSHDFVTKDRVYESWTGLNRDPDWSQYE